MAVFRSWKKRRQKKKVLKLLCVKHSYGQEYYSLPGGGLETEDGSVQSRGRDEVAEETGLLVRIIRFFGIFSLQRKPDSVPEVVLLYHGRRVKGRLGVGIDPKEISWCGYLTIEEIRAIGVGPGKFSPYQMVMAECAFTQQASLRNGGSKPTWGDLTPEGIKPFR